MLSSNRFEKFFISFKSFHKKSDVNLDLFIGIYYNKRKILIIKLLRFLYDIYNHIIRSITLNLCNWLTIIVLKICTYLNTLICIVVV